MEEAFRGHLLVRMKADAAPHASRSVDVSIITDMTTHSQRLQLMLWRALGILVGVSTVTHGLSMTRRLIVRKTWCDVVIGHVCRPRRFFVHRHERHPPD